MVLSPELLELVTTTSAASRDLAKRPQHVPTDFIYEGISDQDLSDIEAFRQRVDSLLEGQKANTNMFLPRT